MKAKTVRERQRVREMKGGEANKIVAGVQVVQCKSCYWIAGWVTAPFSRSTITCLAKKGMRQESIDINMWWWRYFRVANNSFPRSVCLPVRSLFFFFFKARVRKCLHAEWQPVPNRFKRAWKSARKILPWDSEKWRSVIPLSPRPPGVSLSVSLPVKI